MSAHKQFQSNRSSRLAGYTQHKYVYECLVLSHIEDIVVFRAFQVFYPEILKLFL